MPDGTEKAPADTVGSVDKRTLVSEAWRVRRRPASTLFDIAQTLDMREGLDHAVRTPCVRRSLLFGMTGAFAIGGLRWVFSRSASLGAFCAWLRSCRHSLGTELGAGAWLSACARSSVRSRLARLDLTRSTKCTNDIARQRQRIAQAIELNKERARQRAEGVPQPKLPKGVLGAEPSVATPPSPSPPRAEPTGRLI